MTADASLQVNYYEVLGANPMDQLDRIEDLFRQLAYEAETSGDHSKVPMAVEAFKVLRDPAQRQQYDHRLAQQLHLMAAQQNLQVNHGQSQSVGQALPADQALQPNPTAPSQYQATPSQPSQYVATPSQVMPAPEQGQVAQGQVAQGQQAPLEQPSVSIPNVRFESAVMESSEQPAAPPQQAPAVVAAAAQIGTEHPPEFCAKTTQRQRREILAKFYKRRRDDARNPGLAIGGLEQQVDFSYEVLEFHLWFMQQREWLLRLESGMFTITYSGVEEHEKNLIEGLV